MRLPMDFVYIYTFLTIFQVSASTSVAATTSVEPTTSVAATTSVEPTTSVAATTSVEPTTSVAATTSVEPTTSVAATTSVEPTTSVATTTSVKPTTSVATTTSVTTTTSVAATTSVNPTTSVAATTSVKPTTSVAATTSVKPTTSVATTTSVKPTTSVAATTSVKPTTSVAATTSVEPTTSVAATTSVETTTSVAATTSVKPTTSVATTTSIKPTTSIATTTSVEPTTTVSTTTTVVTSPTVSPAPSVTQTDSVEPPSSDVITTSVATTSTIVPTSSSVTTPTTSPVRIDATLNISHPFEIALLNRSSDEHITLKTDIENICKKRFGRPTFERCLVTRFRKGSTIVDLSIFFRGGTRISAAEVEEIIKMKNDDAPWTFEIYSVNATVITGPTPEPTQKPSEFESWKIVLIVFGVICFILLIILLLNYIWKKRVQSGYQMTNDHKGRNEIMEYNMQTWHHNKGQYNSDFELYEVSGSQVAVYDNPDAREGSTGQYATLDLYDNVNKEGQYQGLTSKNEEYSNTARDNGAYITHYD